MPAASFAEIRWVIYCQRPSLGLIRVELYQLEHMEPQARLDRIDRIFRHASQTHTARLTRGEG